MRWFGRPEPRCDHYGHGMFAVYHIEEEEYNGDMQAVFGGNGMYRKVIGVVYCTNCNALKEVNNRHSHWRPATDREKELWKKHGWPREHWETLPFTGKENEQ